MDENNISNTNNELNNNIEEHHSSFFEPPKVDNTPVNNQEHKDYFKVVSEDEIVNLESSSPFQEHKVEEEEHFSIKPLLTGIIFLVIFSLGCYGLFRFVENRNKVYMGYDESIPVRNPSYSSYMMINGKGTMTLNGNSYNIKIKDYKFLASSFYYYAYIEIDVYIDGNDNIVDFKIYKADTDIEVKARNEDDLRKELKLKPYGEYEEEITFLDITKMANATEVNGKYSYFRSVLIRFESTGQELEANLVVPFDADLDVLPYEINSKHKVRYLIQRGITTDETYILEVLD